MSEMKKVGVVAEIERLRNSKNGNPRWRISFTDGQVFETASDSTVGYGVQDYLQPGMTTTYWLDPQGRLTSFWEEQG